MTPTSATEIRFSIVGPGRVGSSLGNWLTERGARLEIVAGRHGDRVAALGDRLGARASTVEQLETDDQDLLLVAVSDDAISEVARQLAGRPQATVALHVSGTLGAEPLAPLRDRGSSIGTLHPLRAFPQPSSSVEGNLRSAERCVWSTFPSGLKAHTTLLMLSAT